MTSSKPVVGVLGPLTIHTAAGPQAICGQQGLVLAVLAAAHPRSVAGEALLDELWSDRPPSSARTALRVVLTRLRERLRPARVRIVHDGGAYRLDSAEDQLDHLRFLEMIDRATAISAREPLPAADLLRAALDLWRGEPFAPFMDAERIRAVAVHLAEQRRHAEESLVEALLAGGRPAVAATVATTLVEAEPYRELRWEQLMLALYRSGRQAQALHTARRATGLLQEELGIEPWPGLRVLERDILCQAPHLRAPRGRVDPGIGVNAISSTRALRRSG